MTKESYLHALENLLKKHLSKSEIDDILRDYGEYFDDGRRQNKTDTEISAKLGAPEIIAQQFIEEIGSREENRTEKALHTIKEGTGKAFSTIKEGTEKAITSLKKEKENENTTNSRQKTANIDVLKKSGKGIFSIVKSICLFCFFAFLQFFFTIFVYGFCILSAICFIALALFGIVCLGFTMAFFPPILSLSLFFAIVASFALAALFGILTFYILRINIRFIRQCFRPYRNKKEVA